MAEKRAEFLPLARVLDGIASEERKPDQIRADLEALGYDPAALARQLELQARELSAKARLSWMAHAETVQMQLDSAVKRLTSWTTRSRDEIEAAFNDVIAGRFGPVAQTRLRTAFNNATELTPEIKATFLDDVELLGALKRPERKDRE